MSVIARCPDGTIRLYCKGADSKVMGKVRRDTPATLLSKTEANLHDFAKQVSVGGRAGGRVDGEGQGTCLCMLAAGGQAV
jgi:hypothetical protein